LNDSEIIALSEKRERAVQRLCKAIEACEKAELTREELAQLLQPLRARPTRHSAKIVFSGGVFHHLGNRDARLLIETAYRALPAGGMFVFTHADADSRYAPLGRNLDVTLVLRSKEQLFALCEASGISRANVKIRRRAQTLRVEIVKLQ
jgi:hypothetical protein